MNSNLPPRSQSALFAGQSCQLLSTAAIFSRDRTEAVNLENSPQTNWTIRASVSMLTAMWEFAAMALVVHKAVPTNTDG